MQLSASSKERAADGGVLGEARVKSGPETIQGSEIWDGHGQPKNRGFVYGFEKTLFGSKYLFEPRRHMFLDGSTGAGKSRALLIPTIDLLTYGADDGESSPQTIIVSDVKSELIELTGDELERRGYRVLLLDAQHPERSDTFNPLELVDRLANGRFVGGGAGRGRRRPYARRRGERCEGEPLDGIRAIAARGDDPSGRTGRGLPTELQASCDGLSHHMLGDGGDRRRPMRAAERPVPLPATGASGALACLAVHLEWR